MVAAIAAHGAAAQTLEVHGSGTTNPSKFFWDIMDSFMAMTRRDIRLTYRAVGSSTGQREFTQSSDNDYTAGLTDFGSGDIPMTNARWQGLQTAGRGAVHVPFALGAIGIFHSVPEGEVGAQGLKLKPCVLAKIFSGAITEWTDPEIAVDNPGMAGIPAGTKIQVGHRSSSSTSGVSGYLVAATAAAGCTADWTLGSGSTLTWPTAPAHTNFHPVEGSGGMTDHIASTKYAIGYIDAGHGHQRGFSEVHLQNPAGTWLTSKMAMASGASPGTERHRSCRCSSGLCRHHSCRCRRRLECREPVQPRWHRHLAHRPSLLPLRDNGHGLVVNRQGILVEGLRRLCH